MAVEVTLMNDQVNAIHALGEQIGTKLARAEELGAEGSVEESLKLMEEVEALKKQKAEAEVLLYVFVMCSFPSLESIRTYLLPVDDCDTLYILTRLLIC